MPVKTIEVPEERSKVERYLDLLKRHWYIPVALIAGLGGLALLMGFVPSFRREHRLIAASLAYGVLAGYPIADYVVRKLGDEPGVWFVDLDAEDLDAGAIAWMPASDFARLEVVDGDLDQWGPNLYAGKHLDFQSGTVRGVWRGTLTDRELQAALNNVRAAREMALEDAKARYDLEANFWPIIYRGVASETRSLVDAFESIHLPDKGEGLDQAIEQAIEDADSQALDERIDLDELIEQHAEAKADANLDDRVERAELDEHDEPMEVPNDSS